LIAFAFGASNFTFKLSDPLNYDSYPAEGVDRDVSNDQSTKTSTNKHNRF